jgi:GNAT superfamily N-acetyltransferase
LNLQNKVPVAGRSSLYVRLMSGLARRANLSAFRFFKRQLDPNADVAVPGGLALGMLGKLDLVPYCREIGLDLPAEKAEAAFARGDLCAGAFEGARLVGYCWFAFSPLPHLDGVWVDFHREGVWIYKSFVLASHRGRGIASALYRFTDSLCVSRNRKFSICCIETHNGPSISAIQRAGYMAAGYAGYLGRGARLLTWSSPAVRRMAIRFHADTS